MIICQDSDSEFLWKNPAPNQVPFIYETYVYSIENYCIYPIPLSKLVFDITLVEYDFEPFLERYSSCISVLFYLWIYAKRDRIGRLLKWLSVDRLKEIISFDLSLFETLADDQALITELEHRITEYLKSIRESKEIDENWFDSIFEHEIPVLKESLETDWGIEENNIPRFFQGHMMFDDVFYPFLVQLIDLIKEEEIEKIGQQFSAKKLQSSTTES